MTDPENPFAKFSITQAIQLRWALRDILAKRLKLSPVSDADVQILIELGLVEMQDDGPILTRAGTSVLG